MVLQHFLSWKTKTKKQFLTRAFRGRGGRRRPPSEKADFEAEKKNYLKKI
jgi:hypothetical protein